MYSEVGAAAAGGLCMPCVLLHPLKRVWHNSSAAGARHLLFTCSLSAHCSSDPVLLWVLWVSAQRKTDYPSVFVHRAGQGSDLEERDRRLWRCFGARWSWLGMALAASDKIYLLWSQFLIWVVWCEEVMPLPVASGFFSLLETHISVAKGRIFLFSSHYRS